MNEIWSPVKRIPKLKSDDVHVWRIDIDLERGLSFEGRLSESEIQAASRFYFDQDRHRYVASHVALNDLLVRYLSVQLDDLRFTKGPHGKPALEGDHADLKFNLSHSGEMALIAFSRAAEVGVDVEEVRPDFGTMDIANRFFSRDEVAALQAQPEELQVKAFFEVWSRKEAVIKATGDGVTLGLNRFTVSLGEDPRVLSTDWDREEAERWSISDLDVGRFYRGAVAMLKPDVNLSTFLWTLT